MPINPFGGALSELNRSDPNRCFDIFRELYDAAGNRGFGNFVNSLILVSNANNSANSAAAAAQTFTVGGTPAAGDNFSVTVTPPTYMYPYVPVTVSHTLTSGEAASVTTAAAAIKTAMNADPVMSLLVLASNASGVGTATALLKGTWGNTLGLAVSKVGTGTIAAGAATFAAGAGANDTPTILDVSYKH